MNPFSRKKPMAFDMAGVSVMIAVPVNRDLPWQTAKSLLDTVINFQQRGIVYELQFVVGSSIVEVARSKVADMFLKSSMSRLLMIDSDQAWVAKDAIRILALSTKMPIVCGAYPAKRDPPTFLISPEDGDVTTNEWGCVPIKGLGLGFTIVQRCVIEALAERAPKAIFPESDEPVAHIFRCDIVDGTFRGEDIAFFTDAKALGYQAWLDPTLEIGHVGAKEYSGKITSVLQPAAL